MILNTNNKPPTPLYALILVGGESSRMGQDKSLLDWHGLSQRDFLFQILQKLVPRVFFSCRAAQIANFPPNTPLLVDAFPNTGPMGALRTAQKAFPNVAWLLVACDMPNLDETILQELIEHRNSEQIATAFANPIDKLPEPLCTIWEQKSQPIVEKKEKNRQRSLRKLLITSNIVCINTKFSDKLVNINTPEERKNWTKKKSD